MDLTSQIVIPPSLRVTDRIPLGVERGLFLSLISCKHLVTPGFSVGGVYEH